ncbi:hypothetical protein FQN60_004523, partial [Etheostoma spectabile]
MSRRQLLHHRVRRAELHAAQRLRGCGAEADSGDYLKEIIPAFFIHHKMNARRLRQVVHNLPSEDGKRQGGASGLNQSELHARINSWVASASANQIRQLPGILTQTGAT